MGKDHRVAGGSLVIGGEATRIGLCSVPILGTGGRVAGRGSTQNQKW